jgi:hypothetical protein
LPRASISFVASASGLSYRDDVTVWFRDDTRIDIPPSPNTTRSLQKSKNSVFFAIQVS